MLVVREVSHQPVCLFLLPIFFAFVVLKLAYFTEVNVVSGQNYVEVIATELSEGKEGLSLSEKGGDGRGLR